MSTLDVDEHTAFQARQWRWQRLGWVMFGLLIVAALGGLLGGGPFASTTAGDDGAGLAVSYQRVVRHHGEADLAVQVSREHVEDDQVRVWLDAGFADTLLIEAISPEPVEVRAGTDRMVWVFAIEPGEGNVTIRFHYTPQDMGWQAAALGSGSSQVSFGQMVLP